MNYLAHFYLSGNDESVLLGQFLGDRVKGKQYLHYPDSVQAGILLHRLIDHETDTHPACRTLRALLRPHCGLHSPIVVDMLLDHVLAVRWSDYSPISLAVFAEQTYQMLSEKKDFLPEKQQEVLDKMKEHNWLIAYSHAEGVKKSLRHLARRVSGGVALERAADHFETFISPAHVCFDVFFPYLIAVCSAKINIFAFGR